MKYKSKYLIYNVLMYYLPEKLEKRHKPAPVHPLRLRLSFKVVGPMSRS